VLHLDYDKVGLSISKKVILSAYRQIKKQTNEYCKTVPEARDSLTELRATVSEIAEAHGYAIITASAYPF